MPSVSRAEKKITSSRQSENKKSGRSSQSFRGKNSKHSRPNYNDLTLNPRENSRKPSIRRAEKNLTCSRERENFQNTHGLRRNCEGLREFKWGETSPVDYTLGTENKRSSSRQSYENQDSKNSRSNSDVLTVQSPGESCRSQGTFRGKEKKGTRTNARMGRVDRNWTKSGGRLSPMARGFVSG